jgi:transposase InsO family protein
MVWGVIGYHGVGDLVVHVNNVNAQSYIEVLSDHLLDSVEQIFGDRQQPIIFQHDNATPHTARATQRWLEENDIRVIQWPAQSPDLNIIENVWDMLAREVTNQRPATRADLIQVLFTAWNNLTLEYIQQLYHSLPRRLRAVIRSRGYATRY